MLDVGLCKFTDFVYVFVRLLRMLYIFFVRIRLFFCARCADFVYIYRLCAHCADFVYVYGLLFAHVVRLLRTYTTFVRIVRVFFTYTDYLHDVQCRQTRGI